MYIGNIVQSTDGSLRFTKGKNVRYNSESMGIKAMEFLMLNINRGMIHPKLHILPSKFCCKCSRTLTTPESLKAGIGPECSKRLETKSKMSNKRYTFLENGYPHTTDLGLSDAEEMLERYSRIYPDLEFGILEQ